MQLEPETPHPSFPATDGDPPRVSQADRTAAARILDTSANRCAEGLRIIEDQLRFRWGDKFLVQEIKSIRHALVACLDMAVPQRRRFTARDTLGDVGTAISTPQEMRRDTMREVLVASFSRAQQAARSMEEHLKLFDAQAAAHAERIRYKLYTLQKSAMTMAYSRHALQKIRIYAVVDGGNSLDAFDSYIGRLMEAGVDAIQLREKRLPDRDLLPRAEALRNQAASQGVLFVMNDRPDLAVLSSADGVHLGQDDMSVVDARRIVGEDCWIGCSTHSVEQAEKAVLDGADYIGVGPVFRSQTKAFQQFLGTDLLSQVCHQTGLPCFAIGGVGPGNIDQVARCGARRVAVANALAPDVDDLQAVVDQLRAALIRNESTVDAESACTGPRSEPVAE